MPHTAARVVCSLTLALVLTAPGAFGAPPPAPAPAPQPAPRAPSAAELAAIDALLARMTAAVRAGDTGAYLACIVPAQGAHADATFRTEQEAWCADWKQHPPERFALERAPEDEPAPAEVAPEREPLAPARFVARATAQGVDVRLRTTWKLPAWARERTLVFPARFVRAGDGWLYAGEVWDVLALAPGEPAGFAGARIMHEPGDELLARAARDVAKDFAAVRASVDAHFGVRLGHVQDVKLYASMRHLQHSIWLSYTDGLGGWNEPGESIKLLVSARTAGRTRGVLAHEYGHVASFALGPKATLAPWWALEGCADLASEPFRPGAARRRADRVALWASHDQLAPWHAITPFPLKPEHAQYGAHVYTQGEHVLAHIRERFGQAGYVAFLTRLCQGDDTDSASRRALGRPWAQVDGDWRDAVAAQLRPRTDQPEPDDEP